MRRCDSCHHTARNDDATECFYCGRPFDVAASELTTGPLVAPKAPGPWAMGIPPQPTMTVTDFIFSTDAAGND